MISCRSAVGAERLESSLRRRRRSACCHLQWSRAAPLRSFPCILRPSIPRRGSSINERRRPDQRPRVKQAPQCVAYDSSPEAGLPGADCHHAGPCRLDPVSARSDHDPERETGRRQDQLLVP